MYLALFMKPSNKEIFLLKPLTTTVEKIYFKGVNKVHFKIEEENIYIIS